jgi:hypothetical protein
LAALYTAGSRWRVGFDGADWWNGKAAAIQWEMSTWVRKKGDEIF